MADPSPAQLEAGNYRKKRIRFQGLPITIENPVGSVRRGKGWAVTMRHAYGYIRGTLGVDGDHFDVLIGPDEAASTVYLITTMTPPAFSKVDEQKALLGFPSEAAARAAFLGMYDNPRFLGSLRPVPLERFKRDVLTTRENPRMLKALLNGSTVLFFPAEALLKAAIPGGAMGDLFTATVNVGGYTTKTGTVVAPHRAKRKKRVIVAPVPEHRRLQWDLFGRQGQQQPNPGPTPAPAPEPPAGPTTGLIEPQPNPPKTKENPDPPKPAGPIPGPTPGPTDEPKAEPKEDPAAAQRKAWVERLQAVHDGWAELKHGIGVEEARRAMEPLALDHMTEDKVRSFERELAAFQQAEKLRRDLEAKRKAAELEAEKARKEGKPTVSVRVDKRVEAAIPNCEAALREVLERFAPNVDVEVVPEAHASRNGRIWTLGKRNGKHHFKIGMSIKGAQRSPESHMRTLWHEVGHMLTSTLIAQADPKTREAIFAQWRADKRLPAESTQMLHWVLMYGEDRAKPGVKTLQDPAFWRRKHGKYLASFNEWTAERAMKWLSTDARPKGIVEKYFASAAERLRAAFETVTKILGIAPKDGALEELMRSAWDARELELGGGQEPEAPKAPEPAPAPAPEPPAPPPAPQPPERQRPTVMYPLREEDFALLKRELGAIAAGTRVLKAVDGKSFARIFPKRAAPGEAGAWTAEEVKAIAHKLDELGYTNVLLANGGPEGVTDRHGIYGVGRTTKPEVTQPRAPAPAPAPSPAERLAAVVAKFGGRAAVAQVLTSADPARVQEILGQLSAASGMSMEELRAALGLDEPKEPEPPAPEPAPAPEPSPPASGPEIVTYTTRKGKEIRGAVLTGITGERAKELDEYTFRYQGGWFVREKHLHKLGGGEGGGGGEPAPFPAPAPQPKAPTGPEPKDTASEAEAEAKRRQAQAAKLREAADAIGERAQEALTRDRLTNTARRANMAAGAATEAYKAIRTAETMRNLATAIEHGEAKHLSGITSRAAVEALESALLQARYTRWRKEDRRDWDREREKPVEPEDIRHARLPQFRVERRDLDYLAEAIEGLRGFAKHRKMLAAPIGELANPSPEQRAMLGEVARAVLKGEKPDKVPAADWKKRNTLTSARWAAKGVAEKLVEHGRFTRLGIGSDLDLQRALVEFVTYRGGTKSEDPVKRMERELVGRKDIGIDFFPTPPALAQKLIDQADIKPGMRVLEPEAGKGDLADPARAAGGVVDVVELSHTLQEILRAKGHNVVSGNFEDFEPEEKYDRVVMNPPFSNGLDADHVRRAYDMLKPGGRLVAITGEGVHFRSDAKATAFRDWLDARAAVVEKLPEGSFKSAFRSTGVATRLVVIDKPLNHAEAGSNTTQAARGERRNFGWDSYELQKHYTLQELLAWQAELPVSERYTEGKSIFRHGGEPRLKRMHQGLSDAIGMKGQGAINAGRKLEPAMAKSFDLETPIAGTFDAAVASAMDETGDSVTADDVARHWPGRTPDDAADMLHASPDYAVLPSGEHFMPMDAYAAGADPLVELRRIKDALPGAAPHLAGRMRQQAGRLVQGTLAAAA